MAGSIQEKYTGIDCHFMSRAFETALPRVALTRLPGRRLNKALAQSFVLTINWL